MTFAEPDGAGSDDKEEGEDEDEFGLNRLWGGRGAFLSQFEQRWTQGIPGGGAGGEDEEEEGQGDGKGKQRRKRVAGGLSCVVGWRALFSRICERSIVGVVSCVCVYVCYTYPHFLSPPGTADDEYDLDDALIDDSELIQLFEDQVCWCL